MDDNLNLSIKPPSANKSSYHHTKSQKQKEKEEEHGQQVTVTLVEVVQNTEVSH